MNENAKKWVAALRSGDYKQGTKFLNRDDCYCCLGVACELFIQEGGELKKEKTGKECFYNYHLRELPNIVKNWLGLKTIYGNYGGSNNGLAFQNDSGASFEEIADVIESEPEGLFKCQL